MESANRFSLKWNNYVHHITTAFDTLRDEADFVDCTLSCDGKRIKAHRMLLSACSSYFKEIFKENPCQHPVIILKGVAYTDLEALVDFMYNGEVSVHQEQLGSFLNTAELLQVRGLTDGAENKGSSQQGTTNTAGQTVQTPKFSQAKSDVLESKVPISSPRQTISKTALDPPPSKRKRESAPVTMIDHSEHSMSSSSQSPAVPVSATFENSDDVIEVPVVIETEQIPVKMEETEYVDENDDETYTGEMEDNNLEDNISAHSGSNSKFAWDTAGSSNISVPEASTSLKGMPQEIGQGYGLQAVEMINFGKQAFPFTPANSSDISAKISTILEDKSDRRLAVEWNMNCRICGRQFRSYYTLRNHISVHRGMTKCPVCSKVFCSVSDMKRHIKTIH